MPNTIANRKAICDVLMERAKIDKDIIVGLFQRYVRKNIRSNYERIYFSRTNPSNTDRTPDTASQKS